MEPQVQYVHQIQIKKDDALPIRLIHPQNQDPQYDRIAKSSLVSAPKDVRVAETLKLFEGCPYMPVRQLVATFLVAPRDYHTAQSALLKQRLNDLPEYKRMDEMLECQLREYRHEQRCLKKLDAALSNYLEQMKELRLQMENQLNQQRCRFFLNISEEVFKSNFGAYWKEYQVYNTKFKDAQTKYFSLKYYSDYLARACTEIARIRKQSSIPQNAIQMAVSSYKQEIRRDQQKITSDINEKERVRFKFAQKIKFEDLSPGDINQFSKYDIAQYQKHYGLLNSVALLLRKDFDSLRQVYERTRNNYQIYLTKYNKFEDINEMRSRDTQYKALVQGEKVKLTEHLKKNHELMINYEMSPEYATLSKLVANAQYRSQQYSKQMIELDSAIEYVNSGYPRIFEGLCKNKSDSRIKSELKTYVQKFNNQDSADGYNTIILHSLARLQKLADS